MGSLIYDGATVNVDDRALAHLQIVIAQKLRRGESFLLSWSDSIDVGGGRSAVWIHQGIALRFRYLGKTEPTINRGWIDALVTAANSPRGLVITAESGEPTSHTSARTRDTPWAHR